MRIRGGVGEGHRGAQILDPAGEEGGPNGRFAALCTTRQFWYGASRSEARIPPGLPVRGWKMMSFTVFLYCLFATKRVRLRGDGGL